MILDIQKDIDLKRYAIKPEPTEKKKRTKDVFDETDEGIKLLQKANEYWDALYSFREERMRTRRYREGNQWEDEVIDPDTNEYVTEDELLKRNGKVPLKQNIIGQLANSTLGQYRSNPSKSIVVSRIREKQKESEMVSVALEAVLQTNMATSLDADRFHEFLISGFPIQKLSWKYWKERDRKDIFIRNVNPTNIFFNTDISDLRGLDLKFIGERIECTIDEVIGTFAHNEEEAEEIKEIYEGLYHKDIYSPNEVGSDRYDNASFLYASEIDKVVLFEIWYLEGRWMNEVTDSLDGKVTVTDYTEKELKAENEKRKLLFIQQGMDESQVPLLEWERIFEQVWRVKYLTPLGHCLKEMDTPYAHDEHPYVFHAYPLIDGKIWGFLSEYIDQQRYINRLITLWDFVISSSTKGLLMIPENMIPEGISPEEFASEYKRHNGLIIYKYQNQVARPEWLTQNSTNVGIQDMLSLQLKLINEISGVNGALQGQAPSSGTPTSRYALETQNASINLLDKMKHFDDFIQKRNTKILKMVLQFYDEPRFLNVVGSFSDEAKWFDPEVIKNIDFDLIITKGKDAPAYRMMMDELLLQLLQGQFIDIEMYLENTSAPFSDKLLEKIKQKQEEMQQGQIPGQLPPEMMQQLMAGANPQFLNAINSPLNK